MKIAAITQARTGLLEEQVGRGSDERTQHKGIDIARQVGLATRKAIGALDGFRLAKILVLSELGVFPGTNGLVTRSRAK